MDLTEFLAARVDEDEARAKDLAEHLEAWNRGGASASSGPIPPGNSVTVNTAWLPARVLREVAASRLILAEHEKVHSKFAEFSVSADRELSGWWAGRVIEVDRVIRIRAAVYSDHPDYRAEWKP